MTSVLRAPFRSDSYNVLIYLSTTLHASHFKVSVVHSYRSFYQLIVYENIQSRDKADTIFGEYVIRHPIHSQIICSPVINNFLPLSKLFLKFSTWQDFILRRVSFLAVALSSQNLELDI